MPTLTKQFKQLKKNFVSRIKYAIDPQLIYGKEDFYHGTRDAKRQSVETAAQLIVETFNPKEVIDIGCGEGLFLDALKHRGVQGLGCDISEAALKVSPKDFVIFQADATKPIRFNRRFDLCICIEIAEHIPKGGSKTLVQNVTNTSDTIFFTAATPGQGGVGHINEQPPEFWEKLFKAQGYTLDKQTTKTLRTQLAEAEVLFWLYKNLMIFRKENRPKLHL